jgi:hypothetical protein
MFWNFFGPTFAIVTALVFGAPFAANAEGAPSMSTGSLPDKRSHAECLEYSASVMRVLDLENIKITRLSVYGQNADMLFVIRCETDAKTVFFAAAGGNNGDKTEGMVQILMNQFEVTKNLRKCDPRHPTPLHICQ